MLMVLGLVRTLPAPCPDGNCAADYPVGRRYIERYAPPVGPLHRLWHQGHDVEASELGGRADRLCAVSVPKVAAEARPDE